MKYLLILLTLGLSGCQWWSPETLSDYIQEEDKKIEQKISSNNWASARYDRDCDWLGFGRVVDGDTVIVFDENGQVRVRMIGIDTPESKREGTPIEDHALDASRALKDLIGDPLQLCLIQDTIGDQYDIYDRRLSYLFTEAGIDLNAEMLRQGWAKAYLRFPFERSAEFAELEGVAKQSELGRWK